MGRGKKWRRDEDVSLASAYAAVASAGVKEGPSFWDAVRSRVQSTRSVRALRNRWVLMSQEVKVFVQCLDRIAQGASPEVVAVERAMSEFREAKGKDFEFLSCWEIVRKCHELRGGAGEEQTEQTEETEENEEKYASHVQVEMNSVEAVEHDAQVQAAVTVADEKVKSTKAATGIQTKRAASPKTTLAATEKLSFAQQQLASEMRRKNDLQEDELALKLFGEGRESDESQQFFKLLKRKKLLLLEREVDELELAQQRLKQRRS